MLGDTKEATPSRLGEEATKGRLIKEATDGGLVHIEGATE